MRLWRLLACVILTAGCYNSAEPLGSPEGGVIDRRVIGDWTCHSAKPGSDDVASMSVIPFDAKQYLIEWREDDDLTRYRAYSTSVGGRLLINLAELGTKPLVENWVFVRYTVESDGRMLLAVVEDDALHDLKGKAAIREIRRRVGDESLYTAFAICEPKR